MKDAKTSALDTVLNGRTSRKSYLWRKWIPLYASVGIGALGIGISGVAAAGTSLGSGSINLTAGTAEIGNCGQETIVTFEQSVDAAGVTTIDQVEVSEIPATCDGRFVALVLTDANGNLLDEIVWELELQSGDSTITARADASSTSISNTSDGSASISFPDSQTSPEGLESGIAASDIVGAELLDLQAQRPARE